MVQTERFPPAFLISQKSKIFASFPPGEAIGAAAPVQIRTQNLSPGTIAPGGSFGHSERRPEAAFSVVM